MSQRNKAQRRLSNELISFKEANHFVSEYDTRKSAKYYATKAKRRLGKVILKEESNETDE